MENDIDIVKASYPKAVCERAFGVAPERGFYIWNQPEWGPGSDLIGTGQTEYLAWANAAKNVIQFNTPIHPDFK